MKIKDITEWSERWSTPCSTLDENAADDAFVNAGSLLGRPEKAT
jgi:hypothetical protein